MILGTPAFLAPELLAGQGAFDARADIYGLACVAFWLLTGRPPFDAPDARSLLMHHSTTAPLPPSKFSPVPIPAALDALVLECLSKDPACRPASSQVLSERLESIPVAKAWDQTRARTWWEQHEPGLVG
jgi:serine/threonine-protein kinase